MHSFFIVCVLCMGFMSITSFRLPPVEEYVYRESTSVELLTLEHPPSYRQRRSDDCSPDHIGVRFTANNNEVNLSLRRNYDINVNAPLFVNINGTITQESLENSENVAVYQDLESGSAILVQCIPSMRKFELFGTFYNGSEELMIEPELNEGQGVLPAASLSDVQSRKAKSKKEQVSQDQDVKDKFTISHHVIYKGKTMRPKEADYIVKGDLHSKHRDGVGHSARNKRATTSYQVELLMVADYSAYRFWFTKSSSSTAAKVLLRQFYAFVLNGIDLRYKSVTGLGFTITVLFGGLYIAETPSDALWTENRKVASGSVYQVDSTAALDDFRTWIQSTPNLPGHDHAMLFTAYDLQANGNNAVAGLAYTEATCTSYSQSIVEDNFDAQLMTIAAHELGHSLGAYHDGTMDGTGNLCLPTRAFIMSASVTLSNLGTSEFQYNKNLWKFSSCSLSYFQSYINKLDSTNCLTTLSVGYNSTALYPYDQQNPGQIYSADTQCRYKQGNDSYLCRSFYGGNYTNVCTAFYCLISGGPFCSLSIAAERTTCGDKKWCVAGECVTATEAPTVNDTCPFGDQPGIVGNGQTCTQLVANSSFNCYNYEGSCCESCQKVYTGITGCEYGDKAYGCLAKYCAFYINTTLAACCKTCYVPPATTTTARTPTTTTAAQTTITIAATTSSTTTVRTITTTTAPTTSTAPTPTTTTAAPTPSSTTAAPTPSSTTAAPSPSLITATPTSSSTTSTPTPTTTTAVQTPSSTTAVPTPSSTTAAPTPSSTTAAPTTSLITATPAPSSTTATPTPTTTTAVQTPSSTTATPTPTTTTAVQTSSSATAAPTPSLTTTASTSTTTTAASTPTSTTAAPTPTSTTATPTPTKTTAAPTPTLTTSATTPSSTTPTPTSTTTTAAPTPSSTTAAPTPSLTTAAPTPSSTTAAPTPSSTTAASAPSSTTAALTPTTTTAAPSQAKTTAAPTPTSTTAAPTPNSSTAVPTPSSTTATPTPSSTTAAPTPSSTIAAPTPSSTTASSTPSSTTPAPTPTSTTSTPTPTSSTAALTPTSTTAAPSTTRTTAASTPNSSTAAPTPSSTTTAPTPSPTTAAPTPSLTTAAPNPSSTTAAPTPSSTTATPTPSSTTAAPTSSSTTAAPSPSSTISATAQSSTTATPTSTATAAPSPSSTIAASTPTSTTATPTPTTAAPTPTSTTSATTSSSTTATPSNAPITTKMSSNPVTTTTATNTTTTTAASIASTRASPTSTKAVSAPITSAVSTDTTMTTALNATTMSATTATTTTTVSNIITSLPSTSMTATPTTSPTTSTAAPTTTSKIVFPSTPISITPSTTNTTTTTEQQGTKITTVTVRLNYNISSADNLSDSSTYSQYVDIVGESLKEYYTRKVGQDVQINIRDIRRGSLIVEYEVVIINTPIAQAALAKAIIDLAAGENITVGGQVSGVESMVVENKTVPIGNSSKDHLCTVYILISGGCPDNYKCVVFNSSPLCQPIHTTMDIVPVTVAAAVAGFVILIAVVALICSLQRRFKNRGKHMAEASDDSRSESEMKLPQPSYFIEGHPKHELSNGQYPKVFAHGHKWYPGYGHSNKSFNGWSGELNSYHYYMDLEP